MLSNHFIFCSIKQAEVHNGHEATEDFHDGNETQELEISKSMTAEVILFANSSITSFKQNNTSTSSILLKLSINI